MAVRVGAYVFLLYQHLIKEKQITPETGLPPVFPLVLYNGEQPWPSAQKLSELFALPSASRLWAWQPQVSYHLLEERRYPKEAGNSVAGLLFEMENFENVAHLDSVICFAAMRMAAGQYGCGWHENLKRVPDILGRMGQHFFHEARLALHFDILCPIAFPHGIFPRVVFYGSGVDSQIELVIIVGSIIIAV